MCCHILVVHIDIVQLRLHLKYLLCCTYVSHKICKVQYFFTSFAIDINFKDTTLLCGIGHSPPSQCHALSKAGCKKNWAENELLIVVVFPTKMFRNLAYILSHDIITPLCIN